MVVEQACATSAIASLEPSRVSLGPPMPPASASTQRIRPACTASASQAALTWLSRPENPPIAAMSAPAMTWADGPFWLDVAIVPPPWGCGVGDRRELGRAVAPTAAGAGAGPARLRRRLRRGAGAEPLGGPANAGGRPAGAGPPVPARAAAAAAAAPGPPIVPRSLGPPAGNVQFVAWPSVCADHAAGAASSAARPDRQHDRPVAAQQLGEGERGGRGQGDEQHDGRRPGGCALNVVGDGE